jgi:hypothetical protein
MIDEVLVQVTCKFCNGHGRLAVTDEMLKAAGIGKMKQFDEICCYCYGDGFLIDIEYKSLLKL